MNCAENGHSVFFKFLIAIFSIKLFCFFRDNFYEYPLGRHESVKGYLLILLRNQERQQHPRADRISPHPALLPQCPHPVRRAVPPLRGCVCSGQGEGVGTPLGWLAGGWLLAGWLCDGAGAFRVRAAATPPPPRRRCPAESSVLAPTSRQLLLPKLRYSDVQFVNSELGPSTHNSV